MEFAGTRVFDERGKVVSFDLVLRNKIVERNLKLVSFVVDRFYKQVPDIKTVRPDLIQQGCLGLMEAIPKFEPTKGFKFSTYAIFWIRQHIRKFLLTDKATCRIPNNVRVLYNKILRENNTPEAVTSAVDALTPKMKKNVKTMLESKYVVSLSDTSPSGSLLTNTLTAPECSTSAEWKLVNHETVGVVKEALLKLPRRDQAILLLRYKVITTVEQGNTNNEPQ